MKKRRTSFGVICTVVVLIAVSTIVAIWGATRRNGMSGMIRIIPTRYVAEQSKFIDMENGKISKLRTENPIYGNSLSADGVKTIDIVKEDVLIDGKKYACDKIKEYNWKTGESKLLLEDNEESFWLSPHELKSISYFGMEKIGFVCEKNGELQLGIYNMLENRTDILDELPGYNNVRWVDDGKTLYIAYDTDSMEDCLYKYIIKETETGYELVSEDFVLKDVVHFSISHNQKYVCYAHSDIPGMLHLYDLEKKEEQIIVKIKEKDFDILGYYDFGFSPDDAYIWYTVGPFITIQESDFSFLLYKTKLSIFSLEKQKEKVVYKARLIENPIWFPESFDIY